MAKVVREKFKTYNGVFDQFTIRNLFTLESKGYFSDMNRSVSMGKEANIFSAEKEDGSKVILKIYRLENCEFKKMYDYIRQDPRYSNLKAKTRQIIFAWTQREFRNLMKAREAGIKVPTPIHCFHNILILEHIGKNEPAPRIKDTDFDKEKAKKFYTKILSNMRKLYRAGLVHGDLSKFNILDDAGKPVFIDFSQSTTTKNLQSNELLKRDIKNICKFFKKMGVNCDETSMEEFIKN